MKNRVCSGVSPHTWAAIAMMGVLAGAPGPTSVAERAALRLDLLTGLLELPLGAAQKDVFRRVLSALNRDEFLMCSANWRNSIYARVNNLTDQTLPVFAVEGETLRLSQDPAN